MQIVYPPLTGLRTIVADRIEYLRINCQLRIHMAEFLAARPTHQTPDIIFGPSVGGYHSPLFREGVSRSHTHANLESLSSNANVIIGFKEKNEAQLVRFEFPFKAFSNILCAFEDRIKEISNLTSVWSPKSTSSIHSNRVIGNFFPNMSLLEI